MRWRTRILCTATIAAALATTGLAFAAPTPDAVTRPVETFTDWTDSPARDLRDVELGRFQLGAQMVGGARRTTTSAGERYTPERLTDPDDLRVELQAIYDSVLHDRPNLPDNNLQEVADPDLLPDWNGNGRFGEAGSGLDDRGDYDLDLDRRRDVGWFRYPTFHDDGTVSHAADALDPASPPDRATVGAAVEAGFVNSRGVFVDATLWVPGRLVTALDPVDDSVTLAPASAPALVFSDGVSSSQVMYYWFAESMAARGYLVLTYDPAGQGQSDGTWTDTFQQRTGTGDCYFGGACLDAQDAVRWLVGDAIVPRTDLMGYQGGQVRPSTGPLDPADGPVNPIASRVDRSAVGLAGNSMGALSTLAYLTELAQPGSTLPPLRAAVAMSGATASAVTTVPLQLQTSDFDGSPTLVGPAVGGVQLGIQGQGIGYYAIKEMLDRLRAPVPPQDLSLVVFEGGVHTDHARVPYVPRTLWATRLASHYAGEWFDCNIQQVAEACRRATAPTPHLSEAFGSEAYVAGSPAGTCLRQPTAMSLDYDARDLAAGQPRGCFGRAG